MTFEFDTAVEAFAFILKHLPLTLFLPAVTLLIGIVLGSIIAIVRLRSNKLVMQFWRWWFLFSVQCRPFYRFLSCITACPISLHQY